MFLYAFRIIKFSFKLYIWKSFFKNIYVQISIKGNFHQHTTTKHFEIKRVNNAQKELGVWAVGGVTMSEVTLCKGWSNCLSKQK